MPAKRRAPSPADGATKVPKARQSKLAKEHNITAAEELEIKEAFELFAQKIKNEKGKGTEKIIPIGDVRRAMIALNIPPSPTELEEFISVLDPDSEGFALYTSFVAICALKLHTRSRTSDSHVQEVDEAFDLFTQGGDRSGNAGEEGKITMATLQRVAKLLKEDVSEELLRDMILEANGGSGVGKGVQRDEFEAVMRRAGVWR